MANLLTIENTITEAITDLEVKEQQKKNNAVETLRGKPIYPDEIIHTGF